MNNNFDVRDLKKEVGELYKLICGMKYQITQKNVGLGACVWHSIGRMLLEAYKSGNPEVISFVDDELIKTYKKNYDVYDNQELSDEQINDRDRNRRRIPDWADFKKYPLQALEYNKFADARFYGANNHLYFSDAENQEVPGFPNFILTILEKSGQYIKDEFAPFYKKYIYNDIVSYGDNKININIDYYTLSRNIDMMCANETNERTKLHVKAKIFDLVHKSQKHALTSMEINYDYESDWFIDDGNELKLNMDLLENDWQCYRIGNILGQVYRGYLLSLELKSVKGELENESPEFNSIVSNLHDNKSLSKPFGGQNTKQTVEDCALVAAKTGKSSIIIDIEPNSVLCGECALYIVDGKTLKPKIYLIKFDDDNIHVYENQKAFITLDDELIKINNERVFGRRLLDTEVRELIEQIEDIRNTDPFCFYLTASHITTIAQDNNNEALDRINRVLEFVAYHERNKTKDTFYRVCRFVYNLAIVFLYILMTITILPICVFGIVKLVEFIKTKRNQKSYKLKKEKEKNMSTIGMNIWVDNKINRLREYIGKINAANESVLDDGSQRIPRRLSINQRGDREANLVG